MTLEHSLVARDFTVMEVARTALRFNALACQDSGGVVKAV